MLKPVHTDGVLQLEHLTSRFYNRIVRPCHDRPIVYKQSIARCHGVRFGAVISHTFDNEYQIGK